MTDKDGNSLATNNGDSMNQHRRFDREGLRLVKGPALKKSPSHGSVYCGVGYNEVPSRQVHQVGKIA